MKLPAIVKQWFCRTFNVHVLTNEELAVIAKEQWDLGMKCGEAEGRQQAKLKFAVLPLPFTAEEVQGRMYGEFITPAGFGTSFGECNIPAPGPHGYEQRAYYVGKHALDSASSGYDLLCHSITKFSDPANSESLVPVIVTVLR